MSRIDFTRKRFLSAEELAEVFEAEHRANLLIGGFVNESMRTVTLWREI